MRTLLIRDRQRRNGPIPVVEPRRVSVGRGWGISAHAGCSISQSTEINKVPLVVHPLRMLQFWLGQRGRYAPRNRGWAANPRTARNMVDAPLRWAATSWRGWLQ